MNDEQLQFFFSVLPYIRVCWVSLALYTHTISIPMQQPPFSLYLSELQACLSLTLVSQMQNNFGMLDPVIGALFPLTVKQDMHHAVLSRKLILLTSFMHVSISCNIGRMVTQYIFFFLILFPLLHQTNNVNACFVPHRFN